MIHHRDQIKPGALLASTALQWKYLGAYDGDPADVSIAFKLITGRARVDGDVASWTDTNGPELKRQVWYDGAWIDVGPEPVDPYDQKWLDTTPLAMWILNETEGTAAAALPLATYNGTYILSPDLADGVAPDGSPCPLFDVPDPYVRLTSDANQTPLRTNFNGHAMTMAVWVRMRAEDWNPNPGNFFAGEQTGGSAHLWKVQRVDETDLLWYAQIDGFENINEQTNALADRTDWFLATIGWDYGADNYACYAIAPGGSVLFSATGSGVDEWQEPFVLNTCFLAALVDTEEEHAGWLSRAAIWDSLLSLATLQDLATVV